MKKSLLQLLLVFAAATPFFATSYTWNGGSGNWSDASNWTPNAVPAAGDDATVNGGTATLTAATSIQNLNLNDGMILGNFDLSIAGTFNWAMGELQGSGTVSVQGQATLAGGGGKILSIKTLRFFGGASFQGLTCTVRLTGNAKCVNESGSTLTGAGGGFRQQFTNDVGTVENHGSISLSANQAWDQFLVQFPFTNSGNINVGNFCVLGLISAPTQLTGGTIVIQTGGSTHNLRFTGSSLTNSNHISSLVFQGTGTQQFQNNNGNIGIGIGGPFSINSGSTVQYSGSGNMHGSFTLAGTLAGEGSITMTTGAAMTNTGTIAPGGSGIGTLGISRTSGGVPISILEMNFTAPANHDILNITGNINLSAATLNLTAPLSGVTNGTYPIVTWTGTRTSDFANVNLPLGYSISYDDAAKKVNLIVNVECFALKINTTKPHCTGDANATATAKPTGNPALYTYSWSNGATSQILTGLTAGTYSVTATRISSGCTHTASTTIADPPLLEVSIIAKMSKCFGDQAGELRAKPTGGTGGKTYSWSNGGTSNIIENLAPDNYSVLVTDSKACTATAAHDLTEPSQVMLSVSSETEPDGQFTVTLSTSGGTPFPTGSAYRWCREKPDLTCGFLQNPVFENLVAGSHTFKTRDRFNCQASSTVSLPPSKPAKSSDREQASFSTEKIENQSFAVSPNPFSDKLRLSKTAAVAQNFSVKIYDSAGRLVAERDWSAASVSPEARLEIETSGLALGVFFVKIFDEKNGLLATLRAVKF